MNGYVKESISKRELSESRARKALNLQGGQEHASTRRELRHGAWIAKARRSLKMRRFSSPVFALLLIFTVLFVGSVFVFENVDILTGPIYAVKVVLTTLFAVSLGFILSVWWAATARYDDKLKEAERIDIEYREFLMSFSDSLFDIINALNTLAAKPPKPFVVATEFLLGEYVHLLQSRLQRYGDYIAGLGFDATDFLDEKIEIFEGIRERASLSIRGMPKELEGLFVESLNLNITNLADASAQRQARIQSKLQELAESESVPTTDA
jgi:hypothetical protein